MNLEVAGSWVLGDPSRGEHVERTKQLAEELDRCIDFLTWELRPPALDQLGLAAALRGLVDGWSERFGIPADFDTSGTNTLRLAPDAEANLYRIAQEALHNIVKHACATHVSVLLQHRDQQLVLVIEDNGQGFTMPPAHERRSSGGLGLVSMRERAEIFGGALDIDTSPGQGTSIFVRLMLTSISSDQAD